MSIHVGAMNRLMPVAMWVDEQCFLTKTGHVGIIVAFDGISSDCIDEANMETFTARFRTALKGLTDDFHVYQYVIKNDGAEIPVQENYANGLAGDSARGRKKFLESKPGGLFESGLYFCFLYKPKTISASGSQRQSGVSLKVYRHLSVKARELNRNRKSLFLRTKAFIGEIGDLLKPQILGKREAYRFLRGLANLDPKLAAAVPMSRDDQIDFQMTSTAINCYPEGITTGNRFLRVLSLKETPRISSPNMMRDLYRIKGNFILCLQYEPLSHQESVKQVGHAVDHFHHAQWMQSPAAFITALCNRASGKDEKEDIVKDEGATDNMDEVNELSKCLNKDDVLCDMTFTVVLHDIDDGKLDHSAAEVIRALGQYEASAILETYNSRDAFLGILPGNMRFTHDRRYLVLRSSVADMSFIYRKPKGELKNSYLGTEYLFVAENSENEPFYVTTNYEDVDNTYISGLMGTGKCLALGTEVIMYDGRFKKVEDVAVGDLLMGPDSLPRKVLSLARGASEMYRVTPIKGDAYVVNEEHILSLQYTDGIEHSRYISGDIVNIPVKEFLSMPRWWQRWAKGYRVGIDFPAKEVQVDPYFVGLWLGDGSERSPEITTGDSEVAVYLQLFAYALGLTLRLKERRSACSIYSIRSGGRNGPTGNPLVRQLRGYRLIKSGSRKIVTRTKRGAWCRQPQGIGKHIPDDFKYNSRDVRLSILAGLIDSDGHLSDNCFDIVLKNERLSDDVVFVARSLGFAAYKKSCQKTCCNNGKTGTYFRVSISGDIDQIPTKISRKKASPRRQKKSVLRTEISVEPIGSGEYAGFMLDGDGLFLLRDFTVTHNSLLSNKLLEGHIKNGSRILVLDQGHSYRELCRKYGGSYFHFDFEQQPFFINPFCLPGTRSTIRFLTTFVRLLLRNNGYEPTLDDNRSIWEGIQDLYEGPADERRLRNLTMRREARLALSNWIQDGEDAWLFDNLEDSVTFSEFQVFEFQGAEEEEMSSFLEPLLFYIFKRWEQIVQEPSQIHVHKILHADEVWRFLFNETVRRKVISAGKRHRKHNGGLCLVTQSPEDLRKVGLLDVINELCPTKMWLSNPNANITEYKRIFGWNDAEVEAFLNLKPKRDVLMKKGERPAEVFHVNLSPEELMQAGNDPVGNIRREKGRQKIASANASLQYMETGA